MGNEEIKLSIIIPVYNKEQYLRTQLDSILKQDLESFECILVDDGSTDSSGLICDEYSENYSNFTTIHQNNAGVSTARNEGLKLAKGQYVGFMDADDEICADMYSSLTRFADDEKLDIVICGTDIRVNGETQRILFGTEKKYVQTSEDAIRDFLKGGKFTYGACNKIYRRDSIGGIFYYPEYRINEDKWFLFCVLLTVKRIGIWDHPFFINHRRQNSASTGSFSERFFDIRKISERISVETETRYPHMVPLAQKSELLMLMELLRRMCREKVCGQYTVEIDLIKKKLSDETIYHACKQYLSMRIRIERWFFLMLPGIYIFTIPVLYKLMGR